MTVQSLSSTIVLLSLLTACGGSSSQGGAVEASNGDGSSEAGNSGNFDLFEYLFPSEITDVGGLSSYLTRMYAKDTGEQLLSGIETSEQYEKTAPDTIVFSVNNTGEPKNTFVVGADSIEETVHDLDNQKRTTQRFVNVGDTYLDANATVPMLGEIDEQNAKCSVIEHLATFDLGSATGSLSVASGTYNDVLHVQCQTGFIINGQVGTHTDLHSYFARGKGVIFNHGTLLLIGNVYIIPEKAGTSAGVVDTVAENGGAGDIGSGSGSERVNHAEVAGYRISGGDQSGSDDPIYQVKYESITFSCDNTAIFTQVSDQHGSFTDYGTYSTSASEVQFVDNEDYRNYITGLVDGDIVVGQSTWEGPEGLLVNEIAMLQECS